MLLSAYRHSLLNKERQTKCPSLTFKGFASSLRWTYGPLGVIMCIHLVHLSFLKALKMRFMKSLKTGWKRWIKSYLIVRLREHLLWIIINLEAGLGSRPGSSLPLPHLFSGFLSVIFPGHADLFLGCSIAGLPFPPGLLQKAIASAWILLYFHPYLCDTCVIYDHTYLLSHTLFETRSHTTVFLLKVSGWIDLSQIVVLWKLRESVNLLGCTGKIQKEHKLSDHSSY